MGGTSKSFILIVSSIINHPRIGIFPFMDTPTTPGGATQSSIEGVFQRGRWEWHPTS
jgi:hypothetical protein